MICIICREHLSKNKTSGCNLEWLSVCLHNPGHGDGNSALFVILLRASKECLLKNGINIMFLMVIELDGSNIIYHTHIFLL